jgi:hypothetical protein
MTTTSTVTVSDAIGAAVRAGRKLHGWNREDLAAVCASLGMPRLTATVIYDIESGRRGRPRGRREITADEWITLALALDLAPIHMAVPIDDGAQVQLTPDITERAGVVRQWVRGRDPLRGTDRRIYYAYVPEAELARAEQLAQLIDVSELIDSGLFQVGTEEEEGEEP